VDVTGRNVDVTGRNVDVTGRNVDVTGRNVDVTGQATRWPRRHSVRRTTLTAIWVSTLLLHNSLHNSQFTTQLTNLLHNLLHNLHLPLCEEDDPARDLGVNPNPCLA